MNPYQNSGSRSTKSIKLANPTLKKQYDIWTEKAIKQMQKNAITNITKRIPIMLNVANNKIKHHQSLIITQQEGDDIINKVHSELAMWKGIQIGRCKTDKNEFVNFSKTARNWFNRNKAKIYGNHLFYPIIFVKIYHFILDLTYINKTEKIILFVDILDGILHSTVIFKGTKAKPLIPHKTFIDENLFQKSCANLCKYYKVNCDAIGKKYRRHKLPNGQKAKNKDRSKNANDSFITKIEQIKQSILLQNMCKILPVFSESKTNSNCAMDTDNVQSDITINKNQNETNGDYYNVVTHSHSGTTQTSSQNHGDRILQNALNKSLNILQKLKESCNTFNVSNPSIRTITPVLNNNRCIINNVSAINPNLKNSNVNNYNYLPNRGQNNMVSQARYSPLLTPISNANINVNQVNQQHYEILLEMLLSNYSKNIDGF